MNNFYRMIRFTSIRRYKRDGEINLDSAIRLYKSSPTLATLQVRGPETLNSMKKGAFGIIASADIGREELEELRAAIDVVIEKLPERGVAA